MTRQSRIHDNERNLLYNQAYMLIAQDYYVPIRRNLFFNYNIGRDYYVNVLIPRRMRHARFCRDNLFIVTKYDRLLRSRHVSFTDKIIIAPKIIIPYEETFRGQ